MFSINTSQVILSRRVSDYTNALTKRVRCNKINVGENAMKVILIQDVKGQGKKGDVVEVNEGYARNFLIKKGFAEAATASKLNDISMKKSASEYHKGHSRACRNYRRKNFRREHKGGARRKSVRLRNFVKHIRCACGGGICGR